MMLIVIFIILVIFLGFILDRKYSREPKTDPGITVTYPYHARPSYSDDVRLRYSGINIRQFGQWYNMRFRHIKKYQRHVKKK